MLPVGAEEFDEDFARTVCEFFLDWQTPPELMRVVLLEPEACVVEVSGGQEK